MYEEGPFSVVRTLSVPAMRKIGKPQGPENAPPQKKHCGLRGDTKSFDTWVAGETRPRKNLRNVIPKKQKWGEDPQRRSGGSRKGVEPGEKEENSPTQATNSHKTPPEGKKVDAALTDRSKRRGGKDRRKLCKDPRRKKILGGPRKGRT